MTSKPDSVSTLGYHWTDRTGRPLEPQVHWDATGTTLADASTQWCSSGDPVLICIIGTHWKTTRKPLEDHWKHTGISPVLFQCTLGSKFQAHWIATGRPLAQGKGLLLLLLWFVLFSKSLLLRCLSNLRVIGNVILNFAALRLNEILR